MNIDFTELVKAELTKARGKHGPQNSAHEGYAILLEEVDELWDEVKKKQSTRDPKAMLAEIVQVASCCQKMAEDVIIPMIV
jgi:hypothetical protein